MVAMKAMKATKQAEDKPAMKAMKAMKAKKVTKAMKAKPRAAGVALTKGGIADALSSVAEMKKSECSKIIDSLAEMAATQIKSAGKFVVPGLVMIKTRRKPATKAGKRMMFGKEVAVAAKPAKTVVKAFPSLPRVGAQEVDLRWPAQLHCQQFAVQRDHRERRVS